MSQDLNQPEHIRQEALRNIEMIDGDLRFAQVVDKHFWTVMLSAATVPLSGSGAVIRGVAPEVLKQYAIRSTAGAAVNSAFDVAGQMYKGEAFRPGQTIVAALTGAVGGQLVSSSSAVNALTAGSLNALNTHINNQIYNEDKSVTGAFVIGLGASVFGTYVGQNTAQYLSKNTPVTIGNPPILTLDPDLTSKWIETGISNSTVFMDFEKGEKK